MSEEGGGDGGWGMGMGFEYSAVTSLANPNQFNSIQCLFTVPIPAQTPEPPVEKLTEAQVSNFVHLSNLNYLRCAAVFAGMCGAMVGKEAEAASLTEGVLTLRGLGGEGGEGEGNTAKKVVVDDDDDDDDADSPATTTTTTQKDSQTSHQKPEQALSTIISSMSTWEPSRTSLLTEGSKEALDYEDFVELIGELREMVEASEENVRVLNDVNDKKREGVPAGGEGEGEGEGEGNTTIGFGNDPALPGANPFAGATLASGNAAAAAAAVVGAPAGAPMMVVKKKKRVAVVTQVKEGGEGEGEESNKKQKTGL